MHECTLTQGFQIPRQWKAMVQKLCHHPRDKKRLALLEGDGVGITAFSFCYLLLVLLEGNGDGVTAFPFCYLLLVLLEGMELEILLSFLLFIT